MELYVGMVVATLVFLASLLSVELGLAAAIINQAQFSVLVAVVVVSAILPTFVAQRFFHPHHALEAMGGEVEAEALIQSRTG